MKKIFISLFIALAAFIPLYAQSNEYEQMSFEELVEKQKLLTQALLQKKEMKRVKIIAGTYKIGTDIPAGKYVFTGCEKEGGCYFSLYKTNTEKGFRDAYKDTIMYADETCVVDIIDGTYLVVWSNYIYLQRFVGAFEADE